MKKLSFFTLTMSFISLMAFWIAMSGFLDAVHLTMGVVSVVGVMMLNYKLKQNQFFEDDMENLNELRFGHAFYYFFWLFYQVVVAGFHVLFVIIRPSMPIKPTMVTFKVDLPSSHAKVILGNSITLTPGTLTVDIKDDTFTIHALDSNSYAGIEDDSMPRQVLSLFSSEDRPVVRDFKILNPES
jgi:multicomponent Na+:H+ antiporter subunit E